MTYDYLASCVSFTSHLRFCLYSTCTDVVAEIYILICPTIHRGLLANI